ncbi:helicase C-terminal domain-containing protein [Ureibacillus acetophenoni]|uniref:Helicase-like protein n=1 Tax=Ureibacillus acetophenoni TaxID=614649 RepID=A0A285UHS2_9BACL|nr:helicase C-terminal domain-containing protein [Ureibacillus acetophenoni]SOC41455.1 helicase-like protein [Ureibacillus acetophenoni]
MLVMQKVDEKKEYEARVALVNHLQSYLSDRISGKSITRLNDGSHPEDLFFIGRLSGNKADLNNKFSQSEPKQIGLTFRISKKNLVKETIVVKISSDYYVKVNPTYEEQCEHYINEFNNRYPDNKVETFKELIDNVTQFPSYSCDVIQVFNKVHLDNFDFELNLKSICGEGYSGKKYLNDVRDQILTLLDNKIDEISNRYGKINDQVTFNDLKSKETWLDFIKRTAKRPFVQNWDCKILAEIKEENDQYCRVMISFINNTEDIKKERDIVNTFFNTSLTVELLKTMVEPIELKALKDDYKYNKTQIALGKNCSVEDISPSKEKITKVKTSSLPIYKQYRLKTDDDKFKAEFQKLIDNPIKVLKSLQKLMETEIENWINDKNIKLHSDAAIKQFNAEIDGFKNEIKRFTNGISVLENYPDLALRPFKLMNETFKNSSKGYKSWRLFQIVFIVSMIPDIVSREIGEIKPLAQYEKVDLIYFPTGGGKTETYLGTVIFNMFFDRIRGKNAGTTALIKFPLRLLSLQQLQRATDITAQAELIRRNQSDMKGTEPFTVGYFVGSGNTPNKLYDSDRKEDMIPSIQAMSEQERIDKFLVIDRCPFCQSDKISIDVLVNERRLVHVCKNENCNEGILPLYIIDREVYRYLPTFIVSTLDKSALIGMQRNFRNIFGNFHKKCLLHGYTSQGKCLESEGDMCKFADEALENVEIYDASPSLIIQDELHLVRESLGAFNAHYETFINYFLSEFSSLKRPIKFIAATATISDYEQQVYHLYHKEAIRFPAPSPYIDKSFYAYTDYEDLNRVIVGIAPYGKTPVYSILDVIQYYREELHRLWHNEDSRISINNMPDLSSEQYKRVLKDYWVILEYNQIKNEGMQIVNSIGSMINERLKSQGISDQNVKTMTGDDTFKDVREILSEVERPTGEKSEIDLIAATSMISHGVDADTFNFMIFFGVPKNTAEYIQAYSRAGRKYPALVLMVFNSNREKDSSYNQHFVKFNEYKDLLVEPVPINRWANNAVEKTLPGLLSALMLNHYDYHLSKEGYKIYMLSGFQEAIRADKLPNHEELSDILCSAYGADKDTFGALYKEKIAQLTQRIIKGLMSEEVNERNDYFITNALSKIGFPVMRSLRDTDTPLDIIMEDPDAELMRK